MEATLYAFLDESGTVGVNGTHFLAVAVLTAERPRDLEVPVRRALKKYGSGIAGELKASQSSEKTNLRLLEIAAKHTTGVVAVIVDQSVISIPPEDPEDIYRQAVTRAIHVLLERFPKIDICLDKRYSNAALRQRLEEYIRENIMDVFPQMALISQPSSHERKELQAIDAVAWAFFQKYEHGDARFYDVIASKVIVEEVIVRKKWDA
jgi:hypothetical protein